MNISFSKQYKMFELPCCIFLHPILLWHLSVEQNVRLFQWNTSVWWPLFYSLLYQSAILLSQPLMEVKLCMLLSQEKSIWQKGGAQKQRHRSDFLLFWMEHVKCLVDKDQCQADIACLSVIQPVSPFGCLFPFPCQTEAADRSRGSCLQLCSRRIWL